MPPVKKSPFLYEAVGTTVIVLVASVAGLIYKTNNLANQNLALQERVEQLESNYLFENKESFTLAVKTGLESFVEQKRREELDKRFSKFESAPKQTPDNKHIYGNLNARFTLVEFSDLECPYCKKFHETPKELVDQSKGNVNWQWKHLPLAFHNPVAEHQAVASECIAELNGNRAFWVFIDEIFKKSAGNGAGVSNLAEIAESVGADPSALRDCLASKTHSRTVAADMQSARENGVSSTPATFIVDNHTGKTQLLRGAQPPQAFAAIIRRMMTEK